MPILAPERLALCSCVVGEAEEGGVASDLWLFLALNIKIYLTLERGKILSL
ncbi:MAG: hypothetical protein LBJ38_01980 [Oscillospiraceae bacterium]|jgi:hypothetical protein|nr:hypothetical protein [Oscillospiraceae bacterium]